MENPTTDLLQEFEEQVNVEPVTKEVRFANYIIDLLFFYALFIGGTALLLVTNTLNASDLDVPYLVDLIITAAFRATYFTLIEGLSKGRILGKLITGTVAVREDGSPIAFSDALRRSLSRVVPFEPFSGFGDRPWHDTWTNTIVVKKQK